MAMNGLVAAAATALVLVMTVVPAAVAVTHTVGDTSGWTSGVDYTGWVTGKTFRVGDTLAFSYGPSHSVDEIDKAGYDICGSGTTLKSHTGGDTKIDLKTTGTKYFACPTFGHCPNGMKLAIPVIAASSGPTPTTPSTPDAPSDDGTPTTPATPTPATPTPVGGSDSSLTPPRPSGATKGLMSYGLVMISLVLLGVVV